MSIEQIERAIPLGYEIIKLGCSVLRRRSEEINPSEIGSEKFIHFLSAMQETLKIAKGVGLAAPQVGVNLRLFITELLSHLESRYHGYTPSSLQIWNNPKYSVIDDRQLGGIEGCLSVPGYVGYVMRPTSIMVWALDGNGNEVNETLHGWNARVFLHEYDHLDGIVYVDKIVENAAGQKEFYEKTMWQAMEEEKRKTGDVEWLEQFSLKVDEKAG